MKHVKAILALVLLVIAGLQLNAQSKAFEVTVVGQGEPLLFFPGFTCTAEVWDETVAELSTSYECHVFAFAGFGEIAPIEFPWYPKIETAVLAYINQNNLQEAIPIGHSLGGTLALSLAAKQPLFKELIIVDALPASGALMFPDYKSENMVYDNPFSQQQLQMDTASFKQMAKQMAAGMALNSEKHQKLVDWMVQTDRETYVKGYVDYLKVDLREDLANIKIPATILAATHPFGREMAKNTYSTQYQKLSDYEISFAENAAHFIMYDQPDWFLAELKAILDLNE